MKRILVVEDSDGDAALIQMFLQTAHSDCLVETLADDDETGGGGLAAKLRAIANDRDRRPDLILLDLGRPERTAQALLTKINSEPVFAPVPVIAVSHSGNPEIIQLIYQLNANACIVKPSELGIYRSAIAALVVFWLMTASLPP
ncbi:MAG: response regulator [Haliangiales bacterium]